jgi:catechol 2,3-dioxygenase-like lactoylglutathione lyase family enzyme
MKMIPHFHVDDMKAALTFYTEVLDFALAPGETADDPVLLLVRGDADLMLTRLPGDQAARANCYVLVDDVDSLFESWTLRGLDQSHRIESPVHLGPVDQSWGTREFYATDPAGNTMRIVQRRRPG